MDNQSRKSWNKVNLSAKRRPAEHSHRSKSASSAVGSIRGYAPAGPPSNPANTLVTLRLRSSMA